VDLLIPNVLEGSEPVPPEVAHAGTAAIDPPLHAAQRWQPFALGMDRVLHQREHSGEAIPVHRLESPTNRLFVPTYHVDKEYLAARRSCLRVNADAFE
jgi:hypothetical protein